MRAAYIFAAAVTLGLGAGYAWSAMAPRTAPAAVPKGVTPKEADAPESVEDRKWAARSEEKDEPLVEQAAPDPTAVEQSVHYSGCNEVRAAGKAPLLAGQPGYRVEMDGDGDGIACEPYRGR
jgi:hypothetical protein